MRCLINDKYTIKQQLLLTFGTLVLVCVTITLGICLGLLYTLGSEVKITTENAVVSQTADNILQITREAAANIDQQLRLVATSISVTASLQSRIFLEANVYKRFRPEDSFAEYNFTADCKFPACPVDYGDLSSRSRLTNQSGSLLHSSVYMYDSRVGSAVRTDIAWNNLIEEMPTIPVAIDSLAYLDADFDTMYNRGPNTTVQFYNSIQLMRADQSYVSIHRTYPGIAKNDTSYDPPSRSWFSHAPEGYYYMYGPYVETFTRALVINLSSRQTLAASSVSDQPVTVVSAAVMLLQDIASFVGSVTYLEHGFAALLKQDTLEVLAYGTESAYDEGQGRFLTISEVDPYLEKYTSRLDKEGTFTYDRGSQGEWFCAHVPIFETWDYQSAEDGKTSLIVLMFAKSGEATRSLKVLDDNVDDTTTQVTLQLGLSVLFAGVLLLISLKVFLERLVAPLEIIRAASTQIVQISVEDFRDYSAVLTSIPEASKGDEVITLVGYFRRMVEKLQAMEQQKLQQPKYPTNPFYGQPLTSWLSPPSSVMPLDISRKQTGTHAVTTLGVEVVPKSTFSIEHPSAPEASTPNSCVVKLDTKFLAVTLLLLTVLVALMISALLVLNAAGVTWMDETAEELETQQMYNLDEIAQAKAGFTRAFFEQAALDTLVMAGFMTNLLNGTLLPNDWLSRQSYLASYSLDATDVSFAAPSGADFEEFSGYFLPSATDCNQYGTCSEYNNDTEVKATSVLDLKFRSSMSDLSIIDFIQVGMEVSGMTRVYPYSYKSYGDPSSCYVEDTSYPICQTLQQECNAEDYPPYDPRCRSWYQLAVEEGDPKQVFFQYPRTSSGGETVVTAVALITEDMATSKARLGVLNYNVKAQTLSDSVNALRILKHGYAFLLDTTAPENVIIHPSLPDGCHLLSCAEPSFSDSEFNEFYDNVLDEIQTGGSPATSYRKAGHTWRARYASIRYGTVDYTLVVTVPLRDIHETSTEVNDRIDSTILEMIIYFAVAMGILAIIMLKMTSHIVKQITQPLKDLSDVCERLLLGDLQSNVPTEASSEDLRSLLDAFGNLILALRFASDAYARGDLEKAKSTFEDALRLFSTTHNLRGVGIAHNNLGAVYMNWKNLEAARNHYILAVQNAREAFQLVQREDPTKAAAAVLADRLGNYALLQIEQKAFPESFELLSEALQLDRAAGNIKGYVVRQGLLGHWYLKQGEQQEARRAFEEALSILHQTTEVQFNKTWNLDELPIAEQVALFNLAAHAVEMNHLVEAEDYLLRSLTSTRTMHKDTTRKALITLRSVILQQNRTAEADIVAKCMVAQGFVASNAVSSSAKRVAFALDYSGSMAGTKISAAIDSLLSVFDTHVQSSDEMLLLHFSDAVHVDFPLQRKAEHATTMRNTIQRLRSPTGSTALYDAIVFALQEIERYARRDTGMTNWIVVLTDGEDNRSKIAVQDLQQRLTVSNALGGLIIVGVGSATDQQLLANLASCTKRGVLVNAEGNQQSISDAFQQVAQLIQGQVVLEDF